MPQVLEGLNLPQSQYLPKEYGQNVLEQLQIGQQRQEQDQMRRFLEGINAMGKLYTGSALRGGIEQVLGPQIERQQQLLGNIALQGMEAQRGERLTGEGRAYESEQARMQRDWQAQQNELQRQLQMQMFQAQQAEARRAARYGRRFSNQMQAALPSLAFGAGAAALGGLPALTGLSSMGSDMGSYGSYRPSGTKGYFDDINFDFLSD